jgi:hypothetical protein
MEEKTITPQESLDIIQSMIHTAKNKLANDGFYTIFWGWLVFIAAMTHYITILLNYQWGQFAWFLMPLGGIYSFIHGYKQSKKEKVKTYVETHLGYLWMGFGIAMGVCLILMPVNGIKTTYFFLMLLYGLATFVSGGILKFKPLIIGGIFSFAVAIVSNFAGDKEQLLCISIALMGSYIIPGHLLRREYKSQQHV